MPSSNAPLGVMSSTTISASPGHGIGLSPYEYHGFTSYGANGYPGHVISTTNVYGAPPPQGIYTFIKYFIRDSNPFFYLYN